MPGKHQKPGRCQVFAAACTASEPGTGDGPGALCADIVAALRGLSEVID